MNTNWSKILLFTLLGFALGFIISCLTCGGCAKGGCCKENMQCHGGMSMCEHGGGCCRESGHCDKAGCDHTMGGACCKKGAHGMHGGHGEPGNAQADLIVKDLQDANFQGDTTINIDGGTVNVHRSGDSTRVRVEMREVVSEEHAH